MSTNDRLDRLTHLLYGRRAEPGDYIGGSNAKVLGDAADHIKALEAHLDRLENRLNAAGEDQR